MLFTRAAAGRAINKGEELLLNYGEDYWRNMMPEEVNAEGKKALADLHAPPLPSNAPPAKKHNSNGSTAAKPELPTTVAGTVRENTLPSLYFCNIWSGTALESLASRLPAGSSR